MMSDHRRYRYETEGENYGNFWNTPNVQHNYEQSFPQYQHQYYPAVLSDSHHGVDHYNHHPAIPLSPPSSRPVSVSPDENSSPGSSGGNNHLMPLYSTGRPPFHSTPLGYSSGIKPDPDREERQFFHQRNHGSSEKVYFILKRFTSNCRGDTRFQFNVGGFYGDIGGGLYYLR